MNKARPDQVAKSIHHERYPSAQAVFLAGSTTRGEGTDTSDLDLVLIFDRLDQAFRESFHHMGWPVEVFAHDPQTLEYYFNKVDRPSGIAAMAHMVSEAVPLPEASELSSSLQAMARELISTGPPRWNQSQIDYSRYLITGLVEDLRDPRSRAELIGTACSLYTMLAHHYLRCRDQSAAHDKTIPRHLETVSPEFARQFSASFDRLFQTSDIGLVVVLAEESLEPQGGWLFEGYRAEYESE